LKLEYGNSSKYPYYRVKDGLNIEFDCPQCKTQKIITHLGMSPEGGFVMETDYLKEFLVCRAGNCKAPFALEYMKNIWFSNCKYRCVAEYTLDGEPTVTEEIATKLVCVSPTPDNKRVCYCMTIYTYPLQ